MKIRNFLKNLVYLLPMTFFLTMFVLPTFVAASMTEQARLMPVIISGQQMNELQGKNINRIRVFALHHGKARVIPFQIDQRDSKGHIVLEVLKNNLKSFDDEDVVEKKIMDHNDQLLFMASDLGEKSQSPWLFIDAEKIWQLKVTMPYKEKVLGWVYISFHHSSPPPLSKIRYMNYQADQFQIKSPVYQLTFSKQFIAVLSNMMVTGHSVFEQNKILGKLDINYLVFTGKIEFDEEDIKGQFIGYINGPIRTVKRVKNYIKLAAGFNSPLITADHLYYPNHTEIPVLLSKGSWITNMSLTLGANYSITTFDQMHHQGQIEPLNLKTFRIEKKLAHNSEIQWLGMSNHSFSIISWLKFPEQIKGQVKSYPYFNTQLADANKIETGFVLKTADDFPSGDHLLHVVSMVSTSTYNQENTKKHIYLLNNEMKIQITKKI